MGGKKKKGAKEPKSDGGGGMEKCAGGAAVEGKKSKKKKKNFEEDYEDELEELVHELGLEGGTSKTPTEGDSETTPLATSSGITPSACSSGTTPPAISSGTTPSASSSGTTPPASSSGTTHPDTGNVGSKELVGHGLGVVVGSERNPEEGLGRKLKSGSKKKGKNNKENKSDPEQSGEGRTVATLAEDQSLSAREESSNGATADAQQEEVEGGREDKDAMEEASDDKKKKKKKKKKEEEKKSSKGPGKSAISKIKKMQAMLEEEKLRREQEALAAQRAEEERERARLEKERLDKERREYLKLKEKERKMRRKQEGKPVTKKEREAENRRLAQLAAMEEQGIMIPEKMSLTTEKKKVFYGSRQRSKKTDTHRGSAGSQEVGEVEEERLEGLEPEGPDHQGGPVEEEDEAVHSWEDLDEETEKAEVDSWEDLEAYVEEQQEFTNEKVGSGDRLPAGSVASEVGGEEEKNDKEDKEEDENGSSESSSDEEPDLTPLERAKQHIQRRRQRHEQERSMETLRSPVVCVLGHVDTGKTKILDKIRRTNVQDGEAGGITQQIGATFVPVEAIREQTKMLKEFSKAEMTLPGLLIIDTPGHESFSNLRTRGSSMCDLAVLVVDIMHGLEAQTKESLGLLKKGKVPFVVALNKVDRLYDWHRNPGSSIRDTLKKQKQPTRDQLEERVKEVVGEFAEEGLNVAMFWEKVDFKEYLPMVPTSAITGDGMGDLIALLVQHSVKNLVSTLSLSMELEALVMEVKVIPGLGTTIDVILRNGILREGDTMVLSGNEGPFVAIVRALLMPQPLRELRVKNAYVSHSAVMAAQGIKVTAKGELEKTLPGTNVLVAKKPDEVEVLKEEAAIAMKNVLNAIKLQDRGVYVQASTLGSLEALLEFLKTSKIPFSGINIGPVHKRDVMKASVMLEHDNQWAVILAFDVRIERDAQEMADSLGVKIFSADIIYHLFDSFLKHREELRERNRQLYRSIAVFPCRLRILPNCIFNTRDPIVVGVVVESGIVKPGTPLTVPSKGFTDIGVVSSLEVNHKPVESVRKGTEVCVKIEPVGGDAPRLYGRHFDHTDLLVSKLSRESIDAVKNYFREDLNKSDWQLIIELKKMFQIM